jgi:hypothetical protein
MSKVMTADVILAAGGTSTLGKRMATSCSVLSCMISRSELVVDTAPDTISSSALLLASDIEK